jgi:hypothetical protein
MLVSCTYSLPPLEAPLSVQVESNPPAEPATPPAEPPTPPELLFPGKIAIVGEYTCQYDDYQAAMQVVNKYGEDKVIVKSWPVKFPEEGEQMIRILQQIAADPDFHALIISTAVQNTLAAVEKLLEMRNDIFVVLINSWENPEDAAKYANLVLTTDEAAMGPAMARQAQKLGAKTFVHLSFPRHMSYEKISERYKLLEEECAMLGLDLVNYTVPDPTGDIGMAGAQQDMLEEIPKLVKKYGEDTAFFCTNCGLQAPLIKAVTDAHGIYVQPCCPSPFHGFPIAFGLISEGEGVFFITDRQNTVKVIVDRTREKLAEKNMLGRVSTWPVPADMLNTVASAEYAIKWINGQAPKEGIDQDILSECGEEYIKEQTGQDIEVGFNTFTEGGMAYENYLMVSMGYIVY